MSIDAKTEDKLRERIEELKQWLSDEAPYIASDQRHLDAHTPERAYWHYGYLAALRDVIKLAEPSPSRKRDNGGKTS
jgi:hypothetical protein